MKAARIFSSFLLLVTSYSCGTDAPGSTQGNASTGPIRLRGEPACPECDITVTRVATLGHPDDPASARPDAAVAGCSVGAAGDGAFLLSGVVGGGEILVYGRDGRVTSSIGRPGEGPGEFGSNLRVLVPARDTIIVVDDSNARITTTDLAGAVLSTLRIPGRVHSVARLATGQILLHGRLSSGPAQPLFHLLAADGGEVSSFGRTEREAWDTDQWVVAAGRSADYWAASMWEYELFRGHADSLASAVTREVDWFPSDVTWSREFLETEPPPPLITNLYEDDDALLWVYVAVADPDWAPDIPDAGSAEWFRNSFDTMIEVLDLANGEVLADHRSDDYLGGICGTPLVYAVTPASEQHVTVTVLEHRLQR